MSQKALLEQKVASYLAGLSPEARQMLLRKLDRGRESASDTDVVRHIIASASGTGPSVGTAPAPVAPQAAQPSQDRRDDAAERPAAPAQPAPPRTAPPERPASRIIDGRKLFFEPFADFLIDETLPQRQVGLVFRPALEGIWMHLARDLLPALFEPWSQARDLPEDEAAAMPAVFADLRQTAFGALEQEDRQAQGDGRAHQRLIGLYGSEATYAAYREMALLLPRLDTLTRLVNRLPLQVAAAEASERLMVETVQHHLKVVPADAPFLPAALLSRLANPAILVRLAVALSDSADPVDIRKRGNAGYVDMALTAAERLAIRLRKAVDGGAEVARLATKIRLFHEIVRGTTLTIALEADREWSGRLSAIRRAMSAPVAEQIEGVVPALRQALSTEPSARVTPADRAEASRRLLMLVAARRHRDSLAVNEPVNRLWPLADQAIETYGRAALEALRRPDPAVREQATAAVDLLIRLGEAFHGEEYAALIRRSRDAALAPR